MSEGEDEDWDDDPEKLLFPDFRVCTQLYRVETNPKWALGDSNEVMYGDKEV